jgi:hypothetical protein
MLPDIRVVVTAIATTVLILVGIGLMASIRITHQSLSAQSDPAVANRMAWRQPDPILPDATLAGHAPWKPEPVLSLPHETMDLATLAAEERDLAERVLTSVPEPRYAAASLDPAESPQLAAWVAEELALAHPSSRDGPSTTASVSPPPADAKITTRTKKVSTPPATAKPTHPAAATARTAQLHPAKPKRAARRAARAAKTNDKTLLDALLGLDQTQ